MTGVPIGVFQGDASSQKAEDFAISVLPQEKEEKLENRRFLEELERADREAKQLYLSIDGYKREVLDPSLALLNNILIDQQEILNLVNLPQFKDKPEEPFSLMANVFGHMSLMIDHCEDKEEVKQILEELNEIVTTRRTRRRAGGAHIKDREVRSDYNKLCIHMAYVLFENGVPGFQNPKCRTIDEVKDMWAQN